MRVQMRRYGQIVVYVTIVALIVLSLVLSRKAIADNNRKLCPLLYTLEQPGTPATTERGQVIAKQISDLRRTYGCRQQDNRAK